MPLKLVLALSLAALSASAQGFIRELREPTLSIDLDDPGHVSAWLYSTAPVPDPVAQAFAQAMGCPPPAPARTNSVHVGCPARLKRDGLRWSAHWDFTALNAELIRAGVDSIEVHINHPRSGFSQVQPGAIIAFQTAGFGLSHQGNLRLNDFHEITLESGYREQELWLFAGVAAGILLMPLILFAARAGGPLAVMAAAYGLFCLATTAWLWVTLRLNTPALAPVPWNLVIVSGPLLAAVWLGSRAAGDSLRRLLFWRGTLAVVLLTLIVGIFSALSTIALWAAGCGAALIVCYWRLYRPGGRRLQPLAEGELLDRIRQLAARAGASLRSVQLLLGGDDRPAAFATRFRGILLTGGLLRALSRREVDAIVAHELSHVRRPTRVTTRGIAYLLPVAIVVAFLVPASLEWMPLLLPPSFLLLRALRRRTERAADADAVTWSGDAEALITGLVRVTRSHDMPIEWPGWVKPLMPHPSTMERLRVAAARGGIGEERFQALLAACETPAPNGYPIPGSSAPAGSAFTPAVRARLNAALSLLGLAMPVIFGIAAPFIGYAAALLLGAASALLVTEWVLLRVRMRARGLLAGRPGVFSGFSPTLEPRVYEGSYDYDWGFAAFESDALVFRGDRSNFTVARAEIERVWLSRGPFMWLPRPLVYFQLKNGQAFSLRPFDHAFALAAPRAAAQLFEQARRWHSAPSTAAAPGNFDFTAVTGQPPPVYTWRSVLRPFPRYGAFTLGIYWLFLAAAPGIEWTTNLLRLFSPVLVTWTLALFGAYPNVRRGKPSLPQSQAPLARTAGQ